MAGLTVAAPSRTGERQRGTDNDAASLGAGASVGDHGAGLSLLRQLPDALGSGACRRGRGHIGLLRQLAVMGSAKKDPCQMRKVAKKQLLGKAYRTRV